jgi:hypothetical protein
MKFQFQEIVLKLIQEVKSEIKKDENMLVIRQDIINPLVNQILDELQPYVFKSIVIITSIIVFLLITIILNIRVIMYHS